MEILILIAIIAVGGSSVFVAASFNTRARQNLAPLVDGTQKNIGNQIATARNALADKIQTVSSEVNRNSNMTFDLQATASELERKMQAHTAELGSDRALLRSLGTASGELRKQFQAQADELRDGKELLGRIEAAAAELRLQVQANAETLLRNSEQLDRQIAELSDAINQQSTRISRVYRYVVRHEIPAGSSEDDESLLLAMLEAESYVDDMGWGGRPHLFALANDRPGPLVLVDRGQLPEGELTQVLADTHWLADVAGCVLVTELAALQAEAGEGAPVDPHAAGQWASTHPDGRAARLAVGVRRSGAHKCGIRIKGEDEMRIRTDLADDLVTALQRTF